MVKLGRSPSARRVGRLASDQRRGTTAMLCQDERVRVRVPCRCRSGRHGPCSAVCTTWNFGNFLAESAILPFEMKKLFFLGISVAGVFLTNRLAAVGMGAVEIE